MIQRSQPRHREEIWCLASYRLLLRVEQSLIIVFFTSQSHV